MNTFLDQLQEFTKPAIISREIEHNGKKATFYFKELTGEEGTVIFGGFSSANPDVKDAAVRALRNRSVAAGVCDPEGNKILSEKQASQLPLTLLNSLHAVVMEHNGLQPDKKDEAEAKNE